MRSASRCLPVRSSRASCSSRFRGGEFPNHQARESPPDECFNPPLELFLQVLDGQFQRFALMRVRFASKVVLISPNLRPKETKRRIITPMNLNTLKDVRHGIYGCFGNAKDALFNLVDALSSEAGAHSFPELSFSPFFERTWASLYEALEDGQIDADRLRQLFVDFAPLP